MNNFQQHYINRKVYDQNICIPTREGILNLIKQNYLSEFSTDEEKQKVLDNLGITQEINRLIELINNSQGGNYDGIKHVILRQREYDALTSYDSNTLYFVTKDDYWTFGDRFPVILSGAIWVFGDKFPINLI